MNMNMNMNMIINDYNDLIMTWLYRVRHQIPDAQNFNSRKTFKYKV